MGGRLLANFLQTLLTDLNICTPITETDVVLLKLRNKIDQLVQGVICMRRDDDGRVSWDHVGEEDLQRFDRYICLPRAGWSLDDGQRLGSIPFKAFH